MNSYHQVSPRAAPVIAMILAALTASCAPMHTPPKQIASSQPTVTYKYQNDADLYQADQRAITFCAPYSMVPRALNFSTDPDGSKVVQYDCVAAPAQNIAPRADPNLSYTYGSDAELLNASRNAQIHCMNNGMRQVASNTVLNANGTKTITFQCTAM